MVSDGFRGFKSFKVIARRYDEATKVSRVSEVSMLQRLCKEE
jgi:hypothetical protein